jgi:hypothetical protein
LLANGGRADEASRAWLQRQDNQVGPEGTNANRISRRFFAA